MSDCEPYFLNNRNDLLALGSSNSHTQTFTCCCIFPVFLSQSHLTPRRRQTELTNFTNFYILLRHSRTFLQDLGQPVSSRKEGGGRDVFRSVERADAGKWRASLPRSFRATGHCMWLEIPLGNISPPEACIEWLYAYLICTPRSPKNFFSDIVYIIISWIRIYFIN